MSVERHHTTPFLFEDDRIGLRPLAATDVPAHLAGCDKVIIERLGGGEPSSLSQIVEWLETNASAWAKGGDVVDLGTSPPVFFVDVCASSVAWTI